MDKIQEKKVHQEIKETEIAEIDKEIIRKSISSKIFKFSTKMLNLMDKTFSKILMST